MDTKSLQPGDVLLYGKSSLMGVIISLKTWSKAVHVEVYTGNGQSVASRSEGVNIFSYRNEQLIGVLRPIKSFDNDSAMVWFNQSAKGQKYDYKGLLCFAMAVKEGAKDKMFCSEFATRYYRAGAVNAFHPEYDADKVAPGDFFMSPAFQWIWTNV